MRLDDFTVIVDSARRKTLLDDWCWLTAESKLLLITAAGSAFVEDSVNGGVHFLDVAAARLMPVAGAADELQQLLSDPRFVSDYFDIGLVEDLRARGIRLQPAQVYSFRVPLILGGARCAENIEVADVEVHFSVQGQIARQVSALPDGAVAGRIQFSAPKKKSWWMLW